MKRIIVLLKLLLFSIFCSAQTVGVITSSMTIELSPDKWVFITDTTAFDGVSRAAIIVGISNSKYVRTPVLGVNKTDGYETVVHLVYFPADICGDNTLLVKFSGDRKVYKLKVGYSFQTQRYTILFDDNELSQYLFINKLHTNLNLCMRLMNSCNMVDVKFSLSGASEALMQLEK